MNKHKLRSLLNTKRCTLLGVGPMSVNCIDATIEIANQYEVLIPLIASRRQIDSSEFGGGYVNNWSTEEYAKYVIDNDKKGKIILARDHGGPWQNPKEKTDNLSLRSAMESTKRSFKSDIEAGFEIIHIDTSVDIHGSPGQDELLDRLIDLYEFCWKEAKENRKEIIFEIGTEEQTGSTNSPDFLAGNLKSINQYCRNNNLPEPSFVVIQSGTKVLEVQNIGSFDRPIRVADELPPEIQIPKMIDLCNEYGIMAKTHNTDYLSNESLQWYPRLGIHAANVAPEFGVSETKALFKLLRDNDLNRIANRLVEISYNSRKWEKWMLPDSPATDLDKAIIAGHYVFSTPEFIELKTEIVSFFERKAVKVDDYLKSEIKKDILRYLQCFRMIL